MSLENNPVTEHGSEAVERTLSLQRVAQFAGHVTNSLVDKAVNWYAKLDNDLASAEYASRRSRSDQ